MNDYIQPTKRGKRWSYGFDLLDVGETMACPFNNNELSNKAKGGMRVCSAFVCWKNLDPVNRGHIKMNVRTKASRILITRTA
jgi:hypothetical protein